jgi:hypothetical protein
MAIGVADKAWTIAQLMDAALFVAPAPPTDIRRIGAASSW